MIFPTSLSSKLKPASSFGNGNPALLTLAGSTLPDHASCRLLIERVVGEIETSEVRQIVETVFKDLLRLLDRLGLIENHLRQEYAADETLALFQTIHGEARVLVDYIRKEGLNSPTINEEIIDTLDGIAFAINHDLQRVFEFERCVTSAAQTGQVVLGKLYRAHDLLTNCLQQSTITLAMMFNPELEGARLFRNTDMRYWQSLQLCEDLAELSQLIDNCANTLDEKSIADLSAAVKKFRNESLKCLMYSDWPQFESFGERIEIASTSWLDLDPVLDQFRCYIETLLSQVRMRAVLADVFPFEFGAHNPQTLDEDATRDPF